jgi:preprotein translocase SecF subunit
MLQMFVGAKYKWMEKRRWAYLFSSILVLASVASLVLHGGPRKSVDFSGGTVLYLEFSPATSVGVVRDVTSSAGFQGSEVQMTEGGAQAIVRLGEIKGNAAPFENFQQALAAKSPGTTVTLLSQDQVGPKVGKELAQKATWAVLWSLILILLYIAWRFTRVSFGLGAVIALFHDILITLGVFSVLNKEVGLTVLAALLTIGGYSINDTIIVFDRIRENTGLARRMTLHEIMDKSINQTLTRTILTGGTTILAVVSLLFLGGPVIHDFALAMFIGVFFGTYSSVYVASALALDIHTWWTKRKLARTGGTPAKAAVAR